jgi:hypothetical protein
MRRYLIAAIAACVAVPGLAYTALSPAYEQDELREMLLQMGFLPITPPSNLLSLGSIYSIDPEVRFFKMICPASPEDLREAVRQSESAYTVANVLSGTNYSAGLSGKVPPGAAADASVRDEFLSKVQLKFNDVSVYEVDLERSYEIYEKLMARKACDRAVSQALAAGGYACQGQALLQASAEYRVNQRDIKTAALESGIDPVAAKNAVVSAAKAGSNVSLQDTNDRLSTGIALQYGVSMNPTCIAPASGRFPRVLPRTRTERTLNYIKFNIIEPLLPDPT